jgi:tetratricopeptide (TPR) repeat protein
VGRLECADWHLRSPAFGPVREHDDGRPVVAADYAPVEPSPHWSALRELWLGLPPHPHILDALEPGDGGALVVRYASLDWKHPPILLGINRRASELVAEWGVQLIDAYQMILEAVPPLEVGHFLGPVMMIDLGSAARIGFRPVPPVVACDERSFVHTVGKSLRRFCTNLETDEAAPIRHILDRCGGPSAPYQTLGELRAACRPLSGDHAVRTGEKLASWSLTEEALGWLALDQPLHAVDRFKGALELDLHSSIARIGLRRAFDLLRIVGGSLVETVRHEAPWNEQRARIAWSEAEQQGHVLESERAFKNALAVYLQVSEHDAHNVFLNTAIARCNLALGSGGIAVDYAQRALARASNHTEAHSIRARGYHLSGRYDDALASADAWLVADPNNASAHYTKGRALLALGRPLDARDAFARAYELDPRLPEAMLLRREADRTVSQVRAEVGTQPAIEIDLPEHLAILRPALATGQIAQVLAILERLEYDRDAVAKLVHAHCLAFDKRYDDALAMYDHVAELEPMQHSAAALGKAHMLLALRRADEALALFEQLVIATPTDLEAIEGRALALRLVDRDAEAEAELDKVVAASGDRSALRVRR